MRKDLKELVDKGTIVACVLTSQYTMETMERIAKYLSPCQPVYPLTPTPNTVYSLTETRLVLMQSKHCFAVMNKYTVHDYVIELETNL